MQSFDDHVVYLGFIVPVVEHDHGQTLHGCIIAISGGVIRVVRGSVPIQDRAFPVGAGHTTYPDGVVLTAAGADHYLLPIWFGAVVDAHRVTGTQLAPRHVGDAGVALARAHRVVRTTAGNTGALAQRCGGGFEKIPEATRSPRAPVTGHRRSFITALGLVIILRFLSGPRWSVVIVLGFVVIPRLLFIAVIIVDTTIGFAVVGAVAAVGGVAYIGQ